MKKLFLFILLLVISLNIVHAQRPPVVGVVEFEATSGFTAADASSLTNRVISELNSWGTLVVVQGTERAEYIIRGSLSRQGNNVVLSGTTTDVSSNRVLNEFREQAAALGNISIPQFCAKATERVPMPNYLLGTWRSTINMPDGPVVCIIEFRADRSVNVERYDTWEHRQNNALRYEGYGSGTYTYAGFANRYVTVGTRQVRIDATFSVNLALLETLPAQSTVNQSGLSIVFNSDRTAFEIVNGMLPCGRNFDGPSVYHSDVLGFSQFTKIR
jgi:hypothetical protein